MGIKDLSYLTDIPDYLTTAQFAERMGRNRKTIHEWIINDHIMAYRVGSLILIPVSELEKGHEVVVRTERYKTMRMVRYARLKAEAEELKSVGV